MTLWSELTALPWDGRRREFRSIARRYFPNRLRDSVLDEQLRRGGFQISASYARQMPGLLSHQIVTVGSRRQSRGLLTFPREFRILFASEPQLTLSDVRYSRLYDALIYYESL